MTSVLVLGGGGREHALILALTRSPGIGNIYTMPSAFHIEREPGVSGVDGDPDDPAAVLAAVGTHGIDLVVVGSAGPSAKGVADRLRAEGVAVFGVGRDAVRLEQSKDFGGEFMLRHGIAAPRSIAFDDRAAARQYAATLPGCAVKADGFADGAGVFVCPDAASAAAALELCPPGRVVIQERCIGPEFSVHAIVTATAAGGSYTLLDSAQDYKRLLDGDLGPNTGGVGAVSPAPWLSTSDYRSIAGELLSAFVAGCLADGIDYRGIAYFPVMLTADGIRVLEINVRFGNPEAQSLLARLDSGLLPVLWQCAVGAPGQAEMTWRPEYAVTVASCVSGYPRSPRSEVELTGLDKPLPGDVRIFLSSGIRATPDGRLLGRTGRVLTATAVHDDLAEARAAAYAAVAGVGFPGRYFRGDIASAEPDVPLSSGCGVIHLTGWRREAVAKEITELYPRARLVTDAAQAWAAVAAGLLAITTGEPLEVPGWHCVSVPADDAAWVLVRAFARG